jgi:hypothetical protein
MTKVDLISICYLLTGNFEPSFKFVQAAPDQNVAFDHAMSLQVILGFGVQFCDLWRALIRYCSSDIYSGLLRDLKVNQSFPFLSDYIFLTSIPESSVHIQ